jgi:hypothetical protein
MDVIATTLLGMEALLFGMFTLIMLTDQVSGRKWDYGTCPLQLPEAHTCPRPTARHLAFSVIRPQWRA